MKPDGGAKRRDIDIGFLAAGAAILSALLSVLGTWLVAERTIASDLEAIRVQAELQLREGTERRQQEALDHFARTAGALKFALDDWALPVREINDMDFQLERLDYNRSQAGYLVTELDQKRSAAETKFTEFGAAKSMLELSLPDSTRGCLDRYNSFMVTYENHVRTNHVVSRARAWVASMPPESVAAALRKGGITVPSGDTPHLLNPPSEYNKGYDAYQLALSAALEASSRRDPDEALAETLCTVFYELGPLRAAGSGLPLP